MKLPEISSKIKRLASLDMPVEALKALFLDLAVELDLEEARLSKDRARKPLEFPRNPVEIPAGTSDIPALAPVLDNITSTSKQEESKEKENLTVFQKAPYSKPLPSEPKGFSEFWEIYPRRSGDNDRSTALKAFGNVLKNKRADLETLLSGARNYRAYCDATGKTGTDFIFKARRWLNDKMWNEIYESKPNGQTSPNHKPNTIAGGFRLINAAIAEQIRREHGESVEPDRGDSEPLPGVLESPARIPNRNG